MMNKYKIFIDNGGRDGDKMQLIVDDFVCIPLLDEVLKKPLLEQSGQEFIINGFKYKLIRFSKDELHFQIERKQIKWIYNS